jgi:hypothetical protein
MTLTETLQLKEKYLQWEDLRALDYCEKRWQQHGCPTERWQIINFLERMLRELQANGTGYPKVLLLRKKEIQRGAFTIEQPGNPAPDASALDANVKVQEHPAIPKEWIEQSERNRRRELFASRKYE